MADAKEEDFIRVPDQIRSCPRDFLRRFVAATSRSDESLAEACEDSGEIELSLGLSLGGCFGTDPKEKRLLRSSSIASIPFTNRELEEPVAASHTLMRTCSLPVETEEEQRKRKCLQSLRRLEVKKKRLVRRNFKFGSRDQAEDNGAEEVQQVEKKAEIELNRGVGAPANGFDFLGWRPQQYGWGQANGRPEAVAAEAPTHFKPISQGSIGSQGSCSSSGPDYEAPKIQGVGCGTEEHCHSSNQTQASHKTCSKDSAHAMDPVVGKPVIATRGGAVDNSSNKMIMNGNGLRAIERTMMEKMPYVSTKGDGPNGRRIEGFLYNFRKGEEVRIVCVCHGSFLSPAEFVKHAGGGDVAHPLRHIVVNPSATAFL